MVVDIMRAVLSGLRAHFQGKFPNRDLDSPEMLWAQNQALVAYTAQLRLLLTLRRRQFLRVLAGPDAEQPLGARQEMLQLIDTIRDFESYIGFASQLQLGGVADV